jgi:hypothetical protein
MLLGLFECDKIYVTIYLSNVYTLLISLLLNNKNNSYTPILSNKWRCQACQSFLFGLDTAFSFFGSFALYRASGLDYVL